MLDGGGAIVGKAAVAVLRAASPSAIAWLKMQALGRTVAFLGPSRSGKTSFINYLRTGAYADPTDAIPRTLSPRNTGALQLKSSNGMISIDLKKVIDSRGQDLPEEHAQLVAKHKPHGICIIVDINSDWSNANPDLNTNGRLWIEEFLSALCEQKDENPNIFRKLKSFNILLNKSDLLKSESIYENKSKQIKIISSNIIKSKSTRVAKLINVKPLSLIENHKKGILPVAASNSIFVPFVRDV